MVILSIIGLSDVVGVSHAYAFTYWGNYLDFFRIKEMRRCPEHNWAPNLLCTNNQFIFERKCADSLLEA